MGKHMRKNLIVDDEKIKQLARQRGTSESEAVRWAVEQVLWADEVMEVIERLGERGGIDDVFERLTPETEKL